MSKAETKRIWKQSKLEERYSFELEHKRKDGTIFPVRLSTGAIRYGNKNVIMAIVEDITERKLTEEEVVIQEEELTSSEKVPIFDEEGNPRYLLGISDDITVLKNALEEKDKENNRCKLTLSNTGNPFLRILM